jgi:hypothetical protein
MVKSKIISEPDRKFTIDVYYRNPDSTATNSSHTLFANTYSEAKKRCIEFSKENTYTKYVYHVTGQGVDDWFSVKAYRDRGPSLKYTTIDIYRPKMSGDQVVELVKELNSIREEIAKNNKSIAYYEKLIEEYKEDIKRSKEFKEKYDAELNQARRLNR